MFTAASISSDLTSTSTTPWAKLHRNLRILVTAPLRDLVPAQYIFDRRITKAGHTWITQNFVRRVLVKPDMTVEDVPRTLTQIPPEAILRTVCLLCDSSGSYSVGKIDRHVDTVKHQEAIKERLDLVEGPPSRKFVCIECREVFYRSDVCSSHIKMHHPNTHRGHFETVECPMTRTRVRAKRSRDDEKAVAPPTKRRHRSPPAESSCADENVSPFVDSPSGSSKPKPASLSPTEIIAAWYSVPGNVSPNAFILDNEAD